MTLTITLELNDEELRLTASDLLDQVHALRARARLAPSQVLRIGYERRANALQQLVDQLRKGGA